jgi:hypothetical protein
MKSIPICDPSDIVVTARLNIVGAFCVGTLCVENSLELVEKIVVANRLSEAVERFSP